MGGLKKLFFFKFHMINFEHGQITFCVLTGPARGCFCLCSLGAGSLFSEAVSNSAETPSLSVLPADEGAPN